MDTYWVLLHRSTRVGHRNIHNIIKQYFGTTRVGITYLLRYSFFARDIFRFEFLAFDFRFLITSSYYKYLVTICYSVCYIMHLTRRIKMRFNEL